jgi:hypothetical protein
MKKAVARIIYSTTVIAALAVLLEAGKKRALKL